MEGQERLVDGQGGLVEGLSVSGYDLTGHQVGRLGIKMERAMVFLPKPIARLG